MYNIYNYRIWT